MLKRVTLIAFFCLVSLCGMYGQRAYIDSIYPLYVQAEVDSQKWWHALELVAGYVQVNLDSSLYYADESMVIAQREGNPNRIVGSLVNIGVVRQEMSDYDAALDAYLQALEISRANDYTRGIAYTLNNLATIYIYKKEYDKALEILREGLTLGESIQDSVRIAWALSNIGFAFFEKMELDSALQYFQKTFQVYEDMDDQEGIADMYGNIAAV